MRLKLYFLSSCKIKNLIFISYIFKFNLQSHENLFFCEILMFHIISYKLIFRDLFLCFKK